MATSTGCYLLAVVAEPVSEEHKSVLIQRLNKGLLSWDVSSAGCDLKGLENVCTSVKEKGAEDSDLLIQYSTESLGVEVLVNPPVSTLKQCVKNLLTSTIGHKHIIHAGYTFTGSGSWILQNGTYSFQDFRNAFMDAKGISPRGSTIHIHCVEEGDWTSESFSKEVFTKIANVSLNPSDKIDHLPGSEHLVECLESVLSTQCLTEIMEASPLVGNIRFNRPTLYLFPAGEGDCALFGINGFNMLIDGGFNRKPCSWEFIRHLDRLDAVLVTRLSESNLCSMSTLMKRKTLNNTYPQIGYVFCNIAEGKSPTPTEELQKDRCDLLVSVVGEGHNFIQTLNDLKLVPHQCWRDSTSEPFVLYHKVGHGTLEMHILSPPKDSKEMKDFLTEWSAYKEKFSLVKFKGQTAPIPLSHATSICAIVVWRPNDPKDTITRILFPGSAPQSKIFEGLDKLKGLDILKHPTVTKASLSAVILSKPKMKTGTPIARNVVPNRKNTASPALSVSSVASRNGDIGGLKKEISHTKDNRMVAKEVKKVVKEVKKELKPVKDIKKETKEIKKDVKKEIKEVKKEVKKDPKPTAEKLNSTKLAIKKTDSLKITPDVKKPTVKKTVKKELSNKPSASAKPAEVKKTTKIADSKTAKEVINKKAAESKTAAKPKTKPTHAAAKPSPARTKPTPVPKSPSKLTRAIAASAAVATAAVAVGVAQFIESKQEEEEKEEVLKVEIEEEIEKVVPEALQNGVEADIEDHIEIPVSPLRQDAMSPALSEPISLTASDTLSSAPMETVSPTPPQEIVSPAEEKEVNEIKEVDLQTPTDYEDKLSDHEVGETAETPIFEHAEVESAVDEGIVDDNIEEKVVKETIVESESVPDEQEDAGYDASTDLMTTSFMGDTLEAAVEQKVTSETVVENETIPKFENISPTDAYELDDKKSVDEITPADINEIVEPPKQYDIDAQLASATMEGSFCAGLASEEPNEEPREELGEDDIQNIETPIEEVKSNIMETSIISENEKADEVSDDYVKKIMEQYRETTDDYTEVKQTTDDKYDYPDCSSKNIAETSTAVEIHEERVHEAEFDNQKEIESTAEDSNYPVMPEETDNFEHTAELHTNELENEDLQNPITDYKQPKENEMLQEQELYDSQIDKQFTMESTLDDMEQNVANEIASQSMEVEDTSNISEYDALKMDPNELPESDMIKAEVPISFADETDKLHDQENTETEDNFDVKNVAMKEEIDVADQISDTGSDIVVNKLTSQTEVDYEQQLIDNLPNAENYDLADLQALKEDKLDIANEYETYPTEDKQDSEEKDHDSAEDEEMIRHPTPPGGQEFYQQVGPCGDDEMKDPIGQHFIAPSAFRTKGQEADEPLYEEPEDSGSERSTSPVVVEQPVFSSTDKADFPELVTVSGGTTPSEPQSPKSPHDKKSNIAALDVMEALSEHDCSESSTQSPLVRDGPNAFDHADVEIRIQESSEQSADVSLSEQEYEGDIQEQKNEEGFMNHANVTTKVSSELDDGTSIHCEESLKYDVEPELALAPESEMHCDQISEPDNQLNKHEIPDPYYEQDMDPIHKDESASYCEQDADLVCKPESDQFVIKSEIHREDEGHFTDKISFVQQDEMIEDADIKEDISSEDVHEIEENVEAEKFSNLDTEHPDYQNSNDMQELDSSEIDNESNSVPVEFSNAYEDEKFMTSEKADVAGSEILEQYSHESSTYVTESSYHYQSETPEQNRYSSASTVELDNSKHSNENVSNIDQFEPEGQNTHTLFAESIETKEESTEQANFGDDYKSSEDRDVNLIPYSDDCDVSANVASEHQQYYRNGFSGVTSELSAIEAEHEISCTETSVLAPSGMNGQDPELWKTYSNEFVGVETTCSNGGYNSSYSEVNTMKITSNEQEASYIIDSHYQSDSPEDNSMKNDSPPDVPSPTDPEHLEDPLNPLSAVPPAGYDGIKDKFISSNEEYLSDNLNYQGVIPPPPSKIKYNHGEHPYGESSEDEDSSSLPGNVSPYAYTNKAYNQEDDADGNHIYKQSFRMEQNTEASKTATTTTFDVNNPHALSENTTFESHVAPGMTYSPGFPDMHAADPAYDFRLEEWGKPMGLPTPPENPAKKKTVKSTTTKSLTKVAEKRSSLDNGKLPGLSSKLTNSPLKKAKEHETESKPIYVDLAYVPHHGDPNYSDVEFFKKIRARYYVFSGISPSKEVLNALLEAKKSWKEDLEVTIIPTYETDTLGYWLAQNQDTLAEYSIEVAPSASRCTVNLQDHETSCAAYRLEF